MLLNFINIERLTHSLKTAIACMLGVALTKLVNLPADQWIVITIIVVMCAQLYVGSVLQKAYLRFLGTLLGCLMAAFTIVSFGHTHLAIALTIGISSFIFSYYATGQETFGYAGTLGAVTTAIILLGQDPTITVAAERFLEISLGIFIATLVSQFILPIHAKTHLKRAQAGSLKQLKAYYQAMLNDPSTKKETTSYQDLDETIVKSLLKQRQLAKESAREKLGSVFDLSHFTQSLYCEREILRAITFMYHALSHMPHSYPIINQSPIFQQFNANILNSLQVLIEVLTNSKTETQHIHTPSIAGLKQELQTQFEASDSLYLDGFLFSAEILANNLLRLAVLYQVAVLEN